MVRDGKWVLLAWALFLFHLLPPSALFAEDRDSAPPDGKSERLTLVDAVMAEKLEDGVPINPAVTFSLSLGEVICYTAFDPVPERTVISHAWYRKDVLTSKIKLKLSPPRWSTISRIQLREADKGPWRVEVTDDQGTVYRTLRFSITD